MLSVSVRTGPRWSEGLESEWDALMAQDDRATPFQSREWLTTWWSHFGRGKKPYVIEVRDRGQLAGLFPMYRAPGPWMALRPMGTGPSDYLAPLAVSDDAVVQIETHVDEAITMADLHQARSGPIERVLIEHATCLVVDLPASFEAYLSRLSKSLRYDVRRMDKIADIAFRDDLPTTEALGILFDLHKLRWRSRGLPGAFVGKTRAFQEDWFRHSNGMAKITVLEWKGNPVGAIYTMHCKQATYYYQAGFDPTASAISPGTLLVAHALKEAIERGDRHFDFCRGDEPYKRRWKPDRIETNYRVLMSGSALGRVGVGWNRFAWSIEERVRRKLEGGNLKGSLGAPRKAEPS